VLEKAREASTAENQLKILQNCRDRLIDTAQSMEEEVGERSEEDLIDVSNDMQYEKSWLPENEAGIDLLLRPRVG
jgi:hypothetical protein